MLITHIKTSSDLNLTECAQIVTILREVKKHGFYSAYCDNLIPNIIRHDLLISEIRRIATRANLSVKFNSEESICIFEEY